MKTYEPDRNIIYSRNVIDFLTVANEYCKTVENSNNSNLITLIELLNKLLPLMYLKGAVLPVVALPVDTIDNSGITEEEYEAVYSKLKPIFGNYAHYWIASTPVNTINEDIVQNSFPEKLSDIYQDVKDFILKYQVGSAEEKENAIFECSYNFIHYWGKITAELIGPLHHLIHFQPEIRKKRNPDITDIYI